MRKNIIFTVFSVASALMLPASALADRQVVVSVKGMVCSFCAQGIKKKFSAEESITKVDVSLEKHQVQLSVKDGKDLDDEKITDLLKSAGYNVEKISRDSSESPTVSK